MTDESFEDATPVKASELPASPARAGQPYVNGVKPVKTMPFSAEAEAGLLGSIIVDPASVIPDCIEAAITPNFYYDLQNAALYRTLLDLHSRKLPIDISVIAEELKQAPEFEGHNVFTILSRVTETASTTAHARYFIEKVREQAVLRQIIRESTRNVEDAYNYTTDLPALVSSVESRMRWSEAISGTPEIIAELEASRYDPTRRLPDVAPVFMLGKVPVFTRGNLSTITAQSKSGKSSFLAGVLASTFRDPDHGGDTFTVTSENPKGFAVIHFDTEQHGKHHERMMDSVMRRSGAPSLPSWFYSYARKGTSPAKLRTQLEALLKRRRRTHGGIHSVHLDGIADFCLDVNDPKETNPLITWLEKLAVDYDCTIILVLHLNPVGKADSVQKARGHLGSQLQRKCETDIRLKKDASDITTVFTDPMGTRGEPVFEKDGPKFKWDADAKMHMSCRAAEDEKMLEKRGQLREFVEEVFDRAGQKSLRYSDFIKAIESTGVSPKRAEARFTELKKCSVVSKDMLGFWHLVPERG
jgi:hypothetical protein